MSTLPKERYGSKSAKMSNLRTFHGQSILVGQLPDDFLRVDHLPVNNDTQNHQIEIDEQLAHSLQQQYEQQATLSRGRVGQFQHQQFQAQIDITCVEAKLVKNYGLVNMNPYMRLRVGHSIYETPTSYKGGKNPKWNHHIKWYYENFNFEIYLPKGVDTISIEIFDECMLTNDDLIAYTSFKLPARYFNFHDDESMLNTFEESIILSGKQGDEKEGVVLMVFTVKPYNPSSMPVVTNQVVQTPIYTTKLGPYMMAPQYQPMPTMVVHQSAEPASSLLPPPAIKAEDVKMLKEMFPKIEEETIKSVLQSERGNLDRAINNLLELNSTT
ncbi:hypothetical protein BLOT_006332 [Blomia tropicalis]|nr:hypothetical protein BLOT_006332 [Blomia tropicalis]